MTRSTDSSLVLEEPASPDRGTDADPGVLPTTTRSRVDLIRDYGLGLFLVGLFVALAFSSDSFLTWTNLSNTVNAAVDVGVIACAGTLVIIAGGFDLSAGAIAAVCSIVIAKAVNADGIVGGIAITLVVGVGLGLVNGLLTTLGRVNHFVATLATSILFGGFATAISNGKLILINNQNFANVANTSILGISSATWILIVFACVCGVALAFTVFGRQIYGTGGNVAASQLSGVPVRRVVISVYLISGLAGAIAAIVDVSRTASVTGQNGFDLEFAALAAMLIGGNVAGRGSLWRTLTGVFILALIANGFDLLGLNPYYQDVVSGALIALAVLSDVWVRSARGH